MCVSVPLSDEGHQAISELIAVGEVKDAQSFPLQNAEPLLNLIHPRTVDRHKEAHKARVRLEPCLDLLAFMHTQVIKDQKDTTNGGRNLVVQLSQQGDELFLPLPQFRSSRDLASPRIKGSKQVEGSCTFVLVLQACRRAWSSRERRLQTRARLQIRFLIDTQHHLPVS
jgi:hypothetical protein